VLLSLFEDVKCAQPQTRLVDKGQAILGALFCFPEAASTAARHTSKSGTVTETVSIHTHETVAGQRVGGMERRQPDL
jgi:hypothetical protein